MTIAAGVFKEIVNLPYRNGQTDFFKQRELMQEAGGVRKVLVNRCYEFQFKDGSAIHVSPDAISLINGGTNNEHDCI
jgi:hypothetical protein